MPPATNWLTIIKCVLKGDGKRMLERDQNKSLDSGYIAKNKIHFTTKMLLFLFLKQQFQNQCQPTANTHICTEIWIFNWYTPTLGEHFPRRGHKSITGLTLSVQRLTAITLTFTPSLPLTRGVWENMLKPCRKASAALYGVNYICIDHLST